MDRFQRQKVKDIKDVFLNYSIMQIEQCKKVDCFVYLDLIDKLSFVSWNSLCQFQVLHHVESFECLINMKNSFYYCFLLVGKHLF